MCGVSLRGALATINSTPVPLLIQIRRIEDIDASKDKQAIVSF